MSRITAESLPPVITVLTREIAPYRIAKRWGAFDSLNLRVIDDLFFEHSESEPAIYGFTSEPPHGAGVHATALPLQVALERFYFHTAQPTRLVLNPRGVLHGAAIPQQGLEFSVPSDFEAEVCISRDEVPLLLGELASQTHAKQELLFGAEKALVSGSFFECFYLAHEARTKNPNNPKAWFYELFAFSFFGDADEALTLYEEYPERGSAEPMAQLLAGRYRLLLNQLNEARTILHTVSFHESLGALACCEMARSYLREKYFTRAIDSAAAAISKDPALTDAYLLRGMAQRGIAYEPGEPQGLNDAYKDFEVVAKRGGYAAGEALYHAGTVCVRLGALQQAEQLLSQSLFQRDRISPRDALIRVLHALEREQEALDELALFERLSPAHAQQLREQIDGAPKRRSAQGSTRSDTVIQEFSALWGGSHSEMVRAARDLLAVWGIPVRGTASDCALLDELINRFAPDGDFPTQGEFSVLSHAGHDVVARACALHVGAVLVDQKVGTWGAKTERGLSLVSSRDQIQIPLENFVKERILIGASGDNFSSLESLSVELRHGVGQAESYHAQDWWSAADEAQVSQYHESAAWARDLLVRGGFSPTGTLADLEALDTWIDAAFEPGGGLTEEAHQIIGPEISRCIEGLGFLVGETIARHLSCKWYEHEKSDGISLFSSELGRVFPVARVHRRVFLASAADFSTKLSSLGWSVAVASVTEKIRSGELVGHDAVRSALIERLPSIQSFPENELSGVIQSLLIGATVSAR